MAGLSAKNLATAGQSPAPPAALLRLPHNLILHKFVCMVRHRSSVGGRTSPTGPTGIIPPRRSGGKHVSQQRAAAMGTIRVPRGFAPKGPNRSARGKASRAVRASPSPREADPSCRTSPARAKQSWRRSVSPFQGLAGPCLPYPGRRCALPRADLFWPLRGGRTVFCDSGNAIADRRDRSERPREPSRPASGVLGALGEHGGQTNGSGNGAAAKKV